MDSIVKNQLEEVKQEENKGSRLQIPLSLLDEITKFQKAYRQLYNNKISREDVILMMMLHGKDGLKKDRLDIIKEITKELK